ncbi:hypothetical protein N7530_008606 [Penicillium desertorum]|uniref:Uncharacterized protein n=1 Tax=Penicillium desertorum TaxID=1303715 RepID=A0A9X0BL54_9EURO|nr:hypothetical protein N7530_008606 [Penicillium desertorum]
MTQVVPRVWPVFQGGAINLANAASSQDPADILPFVQLTMAEATLVIFFGDTYKDTKLYSRVFDLAEDIAGLTGLFKNQSPLARKFPLVWRSYSW